MVWGAYIQSGKLQEVDQLGSELSLVIHCAVHYPAYNKNLFERKCGVVFPLYLVKTKNWEVIIQKHDKERKLSKV